MNPILYRPSDSATPTHAFRTHINDRYALKPQLESYDDLWRWSTEHRSLFWDAVYDYTRVIGSKEGGGPCVDENASPEDNPFWFENTTVNWAQNALQCRSESKIALVQATEPHPNDPSPVFKTCTYNRLYASTITAASALLKLGVRPGDRVASYASNCIENVVAFLASAAIGAIWTSAAADFAPAGVLERFVQVQPVVLFTVDAVSYNNKLHPHTPKLDQLLAGLEAVNKSPRAVIVIPFNIAEPVSTSHTSWDTFLQSGAEARLGWIGDSDADASRVEFKWHPTPFNAPLWILFSSGTTGTPKAIVHRSGGMLLQANKELAICAGLTAEDVFFYYTTTGWMMWNFLVGALPLGCTLVLYDGSPLRDPGILWRYVDELGITAFGTSAKYLEQLAKKQYIPNKNHKLTTLRHIYSTGSPLAPSGFDFVYTSIASSPSSPEPNTQLLLASITGGTDICSLFAGFNSSLPVIRGEIQCRMLGMAIAALDEGTSDAEVKEVEPGTQGELACLRAFPCQPLGFWPLEGFGSAEEVQKAKERYRDAYFAGGKRGVWYHGDHVIIMPSREGNAGGVVMLGRSDGVLNPGGIRFGSAEIYDVIDVCFSEGTPGLAREMIVVDALCVGQKIGVEQADERVLLFVKLMDGVTLGPELISAIAREVRNRRSPRHVPAKCIQVEDVPYTLNGKKVEVPVRKIINGAPLSAINSATLRNPECLQAYVELASRLGVEAARL